MDVKKLWYTECTLGNNLDKHFKKCNVALRKPRPSSDGVCTRYNLPAIQCGPIVEVTGFGGRRVTITGETAKEFILRLERPTAEETEESRNVMAKCKDLAKSITVRRGGGRNVLKG